MRILKVSAVAAALTLAGVAHAQTGAPPPPAQAPQPSAPEFRGPDDRVTDFNRLNNEVSKPVPGPTRSSRPVSVSPEDVTQGRDVRDSKGVVIGTIERVGMAFAVIASPAGKIEVEFASLAKNNKGLMINMTKAKFDAILAGNAKPKN
ncbi:hypothetical protein [Sphingomonas sp. LM7]|uniref:hypothetical protein n=1 Tax=Sphingomonas sp. LM7 TaxID=1938607 RepID=UPI0009839731|nr:hypothetical protein [Sphingomonas sp. LM7]AQR74913.1 hypothetical protein BXU08_15705 [Sphingomonas sp. LM7]